MLFCIHTWILLKGHFLILCPWFKQTSIWARKWFVSETGPSVGKKTPSSVRFSTLIIQSPKPTSRQFLIGDQSHMISLASENRPLEIILHSNGLSVPFISLVNWERKNISCLQSSPLRSTLVRSLTTLASLPWVDHGQKKKTKTDGDSLPCELGAKWSQINKLPTKCSKKSWLQFSGNICLQNIWLGFLQVSFICIYSVCYIWSLMWCTMNRSKKACWHCLGHAWQWKEINQMWLFTRVVVHMVNEHGAQNRHSRITISTYMEVS